MQAEKQLEIIRSSIRDAKKLGLAMSNLLEGVTAEESLLDFKQRKQIYIKDSIEGAIKKLKLLRFENPEIELAIEHLKLDEKLEENAEKLTTLITPETKQTESTNAPPQQANITQLNLTKIPSDIREEISADYEELQKCFDAKCYRSSVILCGRILETMLHRLYYDTTGFDILEKNPGIGLGTLIAKLRDKNVELDPGLTNQIHLINNVRVFSVHKKIQSFNPSKEQTQAIILYTLDVANKLF